MVGKCRGLGMASTEELRLVQGDKMVWWGMGGVQSVWVKTNTEKVRTDTERVQDWTKALVAESLTNRICFHACISILVRFSCSVIVLCPLKWFQPSRPSRGYTSWWCFGIQWPSAVCSIGYCNQFLGLSGPRRVATKMCCCGTCYLASSVGVSCTAV